MPTATALVIAIFVTRVACRVFAIAMVPHYRLADLVRNASAVGDTVKAPKAADRSPAVRRDRSPAGRLRLRNRSH